jgi:hypothetical protein
MDGIITIEMQLELSSGIFRSHRVFDLTVRRRTLLEFSDAQAQACAAGTVTGTGVGMTLVEPWEKWGRNTTHILELDTFSGGSSLAGERRVTVLEAGTTIRDYNPFRVQKALKLFGAEKEVELECGSVVKVVKEKVVYHGRGRFCDDIETSLPYVKTVEPTYIWCNGILMDKDNLVVVRTEVAPVCASAFGLND